MVESVRIEGVSKRYGRLRALARADVVLRAKTACALLGKNGAGKSTLLGIVSSLVRPTSGEVVFELAGGHTVRGPAIRRHIGVLAHASLVYGDLTAAENLAFYGRLYGIENPARRAAEMLDEVGLASEARDRPARTYSRGMLQRLSLARALLHDPAVLLLDEPFSGLDRDGADAVGLLMTEARERGRIVIVATHDLAPVAGRLDRVLILRRGVIAHDSDSAPGAALSEGELAARYREMA
ncbi:MAG TPA: ABC transporter ATP-binding protein [Kofleriaceae bacterium]|nr:ABC transporter ATP-binding protein [Kofleriaceae bacterium]